MLIDFVIKRRLLVIIAAVVLLAAGLHAAKSLPLEAYPDIANMQVRVITQVPGKAAEEMERLVTIPLEKELNGLPGADPPRSITFFGLSVITITFDDKVQPFKARQQVLEKIANAELPPGVQPQLDPDASPVGEIYRYMVTGSAWSAMARKEWEDWYLERKFKSVSGVVDVTGFGGPTRVFEVSLDPNKLRSFGITQHQVAEAITSSNGSTGGSYIVRNGQDYMVRGLGLLRSIQDINNVVITTSKEGTPVLVRNVADVNIGQKIRLGQVGVNNDDDAVEGIVLMRRGENPSKAVDNLKDVWEEVASGLPPGMHLIPLYDRTGLVRKTMETIEHNVGEGILLVVVMMMLYLFQVRSALICACVIPLALSFALVMLNLLGVPGNLLSLGAIDFGILVDGSIIMVENIVRHLGENHNQSAEQIIATISRAAKEVFKPVLFATSIIIVTFLPILAFERVEGKLFRPLAVFMILNLIGAVLSSMTIIPVICAAIFSRRAPKERTSPVMKVADRIYAPLLKWAINRPKTVAIAAGAIVAGSLLLVPFLGGEFIPELEEGNIWLRVTVLPTSVALQQSADIAHKLREELRKFPECTNIITQIGSPDDGTDPNNYSNIEVFVDLLPQEQWEKQYRTKQELVIAMDKALNDRLPGLLYNFSQYIKDNMDETIAGVKGELGIKIYGEDLSVLESLGSRIASVIRSVPGMVDVAPDQLLGQPQLLIEIDRDKAARYAVNTSDILEVVETSIGGRAVTQVVEGERKFDLMLRFRKDYRQDASSLSEISVATPNGARIPLIQLADIKEGHGATQILRDLNRRRIAVKANIRGRDLMSAVQEAQSRVAKSVKIPEGYKIVWGGQFARAQHALSQLLVVIPITLALIFVLLYAATGSPRIASLVILCVPLAIPGALLALLLTGTHMSISAGVGLIALFGVSCQNGVILVSLVRQLRAQGVALKEAIFESAMVRMRPAFMTSTVAMVGLIPAALATGIGSQSQKPIAIVIVGGLFPSMALALLVLPAVYEWFEERSHSARDLERLESLIDLPPQQ